jgi:23S rRNA (adenine2030-N6)-methyltransferase
VVDELRMRIGADRRVAIHQREGYELSALLPPAENRGLVLIDPPFERSDEFDALAQALNRAMARFANGVYAIWYPYKKRFDTERWLRRMQRDLQREAVNYILETGAPSEGQMHACGVLVINPPYAFTQQIEPALPWLARVLAQGSAATARSERWPATS